MSSSATSWATAHCYSGTAIPMSSPPFGSRRPGRCIRTLLVFDEVVSGFRWAPGGVQELTGVLPDLTVLGKVLAGGMPGGAVCGRADLIDLLSGPAAGPRRVAHPEN